MHHLIAWQISSWTTLALFHFESNTKQVIITAASILANADPDPTEPASLFLSQTGVFVIKQIGWAQFGMAARRPLGLFFAPGVHFGSHRTRWQDHHHHQPELLSQECRRAVNPSSGNLKSERWNRMSRGRFPVLSLLSQLGFNPSVLIFPRWHKYHGLVLAYCFHHTEKCRIYYTNLAIENN